MIEDPVASVSGGEAKICYDKYMECDTSEPSTFKTPLIPLEESCLMIFDWDDTVLPSSYIHELNLRLDSEIPEDFERKVEPVQQHVISLFRAAKMKGSVCIITNAEEGWVELSCQRFMPKVYESRILEGIQIISARTTYERMFPESPKSWKCEAFKKMVHGHITSHPAAVTSDHYLSVISFGDSLSEREAVSLTTKSLDKVFCKSIKFLDKPTVQQLIYQIQVIADSLHYLVTVNSHLDLMLADQPASTQEEKAF